MSTTHQSPKLWITAPNNQKPSAPASWQDERVLVFSLFNYLFATLFLFSFFD